MPPQGTCCPSRSPTAAGPTPRTWPRPYRTR